MTAVVFPLITSVSIHVPARGTTVPQLFGNFIFEFQSTFPHGERRHLRSSHRSVSLFQSTFPHGERHARSHVDWWLTACFNPRSRTGNDIKIPLTNAGGGSFNPRSRTGNDRSYGHRLDKITVSIHVPARGTTDLYRASLGAWTCFNPRSRTGNDL